MDYNTFILVCTIAQFIVAIIAILLSVVFFISAKNAEKETVKALAGIQGQTDTLKDITSKQMTRLIKNLTEHRPIDEILKIISQVKEQPNKSLQLELKELEVEQLTASAIEGYIGAYYYSAVANCWIQGYIADESISDVYGEEGLNYIKQLVDISYQDFHNLKTILDKVHHTRLQTNPAYNYYTATNNFWASYVTSSSFK
jgi:hypothetical protein